MPSGISYDPNLRLNLWPASAAAKAGLKLGWSQANVIKASEEALLFLNGSGDLEQIVRRLWHAGLKLLVVTRGRQGCTYFTPAFTGDVAGFDVQAVDATGAGDAFMAGLLKGLLGQPNALGDEPQVRALCRYANAVGALTTTQRGALPARPTADQVAAFLQAAG